MNHARGPVTLRSVPRQPGPGRQHRSVILGDDDWEAVGYATQTLGTTRSELFETFLGWYLRRKGVELPARPPQDVVDEADALWAQRKQQIHAKALTIPCPSCKVVEGRCLRGKGRGKKPTDTIHRTRWQRALALLKEEEAGEAGEQDS